MTKAEVVAVRAALGMTQEQLARLLGVHPLTVSKWERGLLVPSPHQTAMLQAAGRAAQQTPEIGTQVVGLLVAAGIGVALYHLLRAAFAESDD